MRLVHKLGNEVGKWFYGIFQDKSFAVGNYPPGCFFNIKTIQKRKISVKNYPASNRVELRTFKNKFLIRLKNADHFSLNSITEP